MKIDISPEMGMYRLLESYPYDLAGALSEFIDNALQAHMDSTSPNKPKKLVVDINFELRDRHDQSITISDNGVGISSSELDRAMKPASEPARKYLSEFGIGMKAASIWLGRHWSLVTKPINDKKQYKLDFDLDELLNTKQHLLNVDESVRSKTEGSGVEITVDKLRDISITEVISSATELHDIYQIYIYRKKVLQLKFKLNGTSSDLNHEEVRMPPKALEYPNAMVKKPTWASQFYAFKYGPTKKWDSKKIKFEFEGQEVSGRILVRETASQVANPGVVLFRYNRMILGSKNRPYRPTLLLGSQNKAAPSKIYMELNLDGQKIDHTKKQFSFDEKRFLSALKSQPIVKEYIKQAEAHRPTYEEEGVVIRCKNEAGVTAWLSDQKESLKNPDPNKPASNPTTKRNKKKTKKKNIPETYHNENWQTLLPFGASHKSKPKLSALIEEATKLPLSFSYSASMLMRSLVESLLMDFIKDEKHMTSVCEMVFEEQLNDERPFTEDQKKRYKPGLDVVIRWLNKNPTAFPESERRECHKAIQKLSKHKSGLNGVVHEQDLTSSEKLKPIRDDIYHLIKTLLERLES